MNQRYSVFHDTNLRKMVYWHAPYANLFKSSSKVMDLGCGTGTFLGLLRQTGVECFGLEIDPMLVEQLSINGYNVYHASHEAVRRYAEGCDGIHVSHVIEHLHGDQMKNLVEDCVASLPPNGLLVIRTPNWSNQHVSSGGFWDDYTHIRPYSLRQLERMLVDMEMTVRVSGYEPFGWEDTFIVARKRPIIATDIHFDTPIWPDQALVSRQNTLKSKIRRKLKSWLAEE